MTQVSHKTNLILIVALILSLAACGSTTKPVRAKVEFSAIQHTVCHYIGTGIKAAPDRSKLCTPGVWISDKDVSREHVCSKRYNPRPGSNVSSRIKNQADALYGKPISSNSTTEADHYFPRWLGGATVLANMWPEPNYRHPSGYDHNPKDKLEFAIYKLTCISRKMSVRRARVVLSGDWRQAYKRYVSPTITEQ